MKHLALVSVVVADYDEAIDYFTNVLDFTLVEDALQEAGKRWVVVAPSRERGASLLLARAAKPEQLSRVGNQTGGRVFLFLHTDDFEGDYARFKGRGVRFVETPRQEPFGSVAIFEDLYGNRWELIERR